MSDRVRPRSTMAQSLVASAALLTADSPNLQNNLPWQDEVWALYDVVGELAFVTGWLSKGLSRVRLVPARQTSVGEEPTVLKEDDPNFEQCGDILKQLAGGTTGQAQMMGDFAVQLSLPGLGWLFGETDKEGKEVWKVLSNDEVRKRQDVTEVQDDWNKWREVNIGTAENPGDCVLVKVWRPDNRYHWQSTSPVKANLPVLRELMQLTKYVDAIVNSRLAGAGILFLPKNIDFAMTPEQAGAPNPFVQALIDAMTTAIHNREAPSSVVPFVVQVEGEYLKDIIHMEFSSPFDANSMELRRETILRFAAGMDAPAEIVTGMGDINHWGAWQVESSAVRIHIAPMAETVCQGLTLGFYQPALLAAGIDDEELVVWYDLSELENAPDKGGNAQVLYDQMALNQEALRRENGFDDEDMPDDEEFRRRVLLNLMDKMPQLAGIILHDLGIETSLPNDMVGMPRVTVSESLPPGEVSGNIPDEPGNPGDAIPVASPANPLPPTRAVPPPAPGQAAASVEAVLAACDGLVYRALERAGNRIASMTTGRGKAHLTESGCPPWQMHTCVDDPTAVANLDRLLEGAWDRVPEIALRYDVDPEGLTSVLDGYTRGLLATATLHDIDRLSQYVSVGVGVEPVPA